jgi:hypothetical protein
VKVLQQRDAKHAVEGVDADLAIGPVIHGAPLEPVALLQSAEDAFDRLLSDVTATTCSAVQSRRLVSRTVLPSRF